MAKVKIEFDSLQMYFAHPYEIDLEDVEGKITLYQPTIGEIINMGEKQFYSTLNIFIQNTTQNRTVLWDVGIDWNEITDFDLFMMFYKYIDADVSKLLFGDLDWTKFTPYKKQLNNETSIVLYDKQNNIEINQDVYNHISQYYRNVFNIFPSDEFTKDKMLKKWWIDKDKREIERKSKEDKTWSSQMLPIISACVNHPGFKYKASELVELPVCQFYDSVQRLQIYESTTALMKGMYSGFMDSSKIDSDSYNFMRDIKLNK